MKLFYLKINSDAIILSFYNIGNNNKTISSNNDIHIYNFEIINKNINIIDVKHIFTNFYFKNNIFFLQILNS